MQAETTSAARSQTSESKSVMLVSTLFLNVQYILFFKPIDRDPFDSEDYSQCGRNASGVLTFTGTDKSFTEPQYEAQPGEFPHMCVIFR